MQIKTYSLELDERQNVLVQDDEYYYKDIQMNEPKYIVDLANHVFRLNRKAEEHLYALAMDVKCNIIGGFLLGKGTASQLTITPREILIRMLLCGASRFVLIHNHPSGDTIPSREDLLLTRRVKESADLLGVVLTDHIIVGDNYYSLHEHEEIITDEQGGKYV